MPATLEAKASLKSVVELYNKYRDGLTNDAEKIKVHERLSALEQTGGNRSPNNIFFLGQGHSKRSFSNLHSPVQLHLQNFINRASQGQYFVNDSWFVPDMPDLIKDPKLREFFIIHPVNIMNDLHKGRGDETSERVMLRDNFKVTRNCRAYVKGYGQVE